MDYVLSIMFVVTIIFFFSQIFLLKKKDEEASGVKWFVVTAILLECFHAAVAGIFTIIHIPAGVCSIMIVDIAVGVWLLLVNKKNGKQKYYITKYDITVICVVAILTLLLAILQFGIKLDVCNFEINDPGNHIKYAGTFLMTGEVSSMYLSTFNLSLCFETALPFMDHYVSIYKIYILCEIWFFFLIGMTLYSLVRNHIKNETSKKIAPVVIVAYLLSYPWNSMLMGSGYLNTGVILAALMMILCNNVINDKINKRIALIFMGLGLYGVMVTYTLFAPIIFAATFIAMLYYYKRNNTNIIQIITQVIFMYIIPGLMGCYFMGVIRAPHTASSSLNIEGYIYKDLYMNVLFFLPFVFIALYKLKDKKDKSVLFWYIIVIFAALFVMLTGGVNQIFSGYYFSKIYYLLSIVLHMLLILYLDEAFERNREFLFAYFGMYFFLMFVHISDAEWRIMQASEDMNKRMITNQVFSLLDKNIETLGTVKEDFAEKRDLYNWVNENISDSQTAIISSYYDCCWYEGLTKQRVYKYFETYLIYYQEKEKEDYSLVYNSDWLLEFDEIEYIVVIEKSDMYLFNKKYIDTLEVVYRNDAGFIVKVK